MQYIAQLCSIKCDNLTQNSITKCDDWRSLTKFLPKENNIQENKIYDKNILKLFEPWAHESWIDYGITKETLQKYGIMWYKRKQSIIIPVYFENNLIGVRERFTVESMCENGKYKPLSDINGKSYRFPTSKFFYGWDNNIEEIKKQKKVWLVESEKSVLKFDSWFKNKNISLGLFGFHLGQYRVGQLVKLGIHTVVLMMDNDFYKLNDEKFIEYKSKILKIATQLKTYFNVEIVFNNCGFDGYKFSPCDFTKEQFNKLYMERSVLK